MDNEEHCDFVKLRQMLIHTPMEELKENTKKSALREVSKRNVGGPWVSHKITLSSRRSTQPPRWPRSAPFTRRG